VGQPDIDPALADWFKVEQDEPNVRVHENSDTETENDSDHDGLPVDEGDDEWLKVKPNADIASGSDPEKVCQSLDEVFSFLTNSIVDR